MLDHQCLIVVQMTLVHIVELCPLTKLSDDGHLELLSDDNNAVI